MDLSYKSPFFKLLLFYAFCLWLNGFARSVVNPYFLKWGLSLNQILLGICIAFLAQFIFLLMFRKINARNFNAHLSWGLSLASFLVFILLIIDLSWTPKFYIASVFSGLTTLLFYIYYNAAHFKLTSQEKVGHSSAIMFSLGPIISILAPLASGFVAGFGYNYIWISSGLLTVVAFFLMKAQKNFTINYSFKEAFNEIRRTRLFIFCEGVWEALPFGIIPVYTLFFLKTPSGYATFLAYLALVSVMANLTLGKYTDKIQKRAVFMFPISIILSAATFLFAFATTNLILWIIAASVLQFFLPLFWSIITAMVVDSHQDIGLAMVGREFFLVGGRVVGLSAAFISFIFEGTPFIIFFFLGLVMLLFPIILLWRTRIKRHYSYI